jgi:hypothetical protein
MIRDWILHDVERLGGAGNGGFGAAALVLRSLSPHFLVFVGIGALLVVGAAGARTTR